MIAKRLPMKTLKKSDYGELVKYICDPQDKQERVGKLDVTNCHSDTPEFASTEVLNTQAQNRRATGDRTYHLLVSFRAGENPTADTLRAVEERLATGLGFGEHQRVSAVHYDTDNVHVHIAINAIHPTRYTLHNPYNDFKTLGQLCDKLENEYGLEKDNHVAQKHGAENRANDIEAHSGVQSLLGWIKQECAQQMQAAQSWSQLHQVLREHGLQLRERGNGLIVVAADGTAVKGSSIDRSYSKQALEGRFGTFQPGQQGAAGEGSSAAYQPKPVRDRVNTAELYARYQAEQRTSTAGRAVEMERIRTAKHRAIEDAKRVARLKRAAIKASRDAGSVKQILYSAAHKSVKADLANIAAQFAEERARISAAYQRRAWADWLQAQALQGDAEALAAMRGRPAAKATGTVDGITKAGTVIYRFGATAVRDDGQRLAISRGADLVGLEAALKLAAERFGPVIAVTGTDVFKARIAEAAARSGLAITFSTPALEQRRQHLLSEAHHDSRPNLDGGRTDRSRPGSRRPGAIRTPGDGAVPANPQRRPGEPLGAASATRPGKPDVGAVGRAPPPAAQNRLRGLSELGVVRFAERADVLLPRDVPGDVEHQGPQPDQPMRRDLSRPGTGVTDVPVEASPATQGPTPAHMLRLSEFMDLATAKVAFRRYIAWDVRWGDDRYSDEHYEIATNEGAEDAKRKAHELAVDKALTTIHLEAIGGQVISGRARGVTVVTTMPPDAVIDDHPGMREKWAALLRNRDGVTSAAEQYLAEREAKRASGTDIPRHLLADPQQHAGLVTFAGLREIDGQRLALLERGEDILILPIDPNTAERLQQVTLGAVLAMNESGAIRTAMRWGLTSPAEKYLAEREAKRASGIDIPRHVLADPQQHDGPVTFAGLREIDGQRLALLKREDDILILPIDTDTAERLTRVKVGAPLTMTDHGAIRTRGMRR